MHWPLPIMLVFPALIHIIIDFVWCGYNDCPFSFIRIEFNLLRVMRMIFVAYCSFCFVSVTKCNNLRVIVLNLIHLFFLDMHSFVVFTLH